MPEVTDIPTSATTQNQEHRTTSSGTSTGEGSTFHAEAQTPMGDVQASATTPAAAPPATGSSTTTTATATAPRRSGVSLRDPFSLMRYVSEEMDRMFENFGFRPPQNAPAAPVAWAPQRRQDGTMTSTGTASSQGFWAPKIDVARRGDNLVVCADLPGMKKEDVRVEIRDDQLVLEGERRYESEEDRAGIFRSERSYGRFYRSIPLPEGVNAEQAEAHFRDGVLEVRVPLPQWQERPGRRIEIR